jgi:quinol-cytochrome oxidoreductase complex cytochrome b subunit
MNKENSRDSNNNPERGSALKHYFGATAFVLLIIQLLTGIFLALYYEPSFKDAYESVQFISNELLGGDFARNLHRWIALSIFLLVFIHAIRTTLRKDFLNTKKRAQWLTGTLVMLPIFLLLVSGLILPWEWKGYWFREMVPNFFGQIPIIGADLKELFIERFTLKSYQIIHIYILPFTCFTILDYHFISKLKERGLLSYIKRYLILGLPIIIILTILALKVTVPSEEPDIIPMPLDGAFIPVPEWIALTLLLPFMYLKGNVVFIIGVLVPIIIFLGFAFLPYYIRKITKKPAPSNDPAKKNRQLPKVVNGLIVAIIFIFISSLIYIGSHRSPTFGCSSCHNLYTGFRMATPPPNFRDRNALPNLNNDEWMMKHWFYPQEFF